jgi:GMP synthase PP-ATPase subunit
LQADGPFGALFFSVSVRDNRQRMDTQASETVAITVSDLAHMRIALDQAKQAWQQGEVPVGALVTYNVSSKPAATNEWE